MKLSYEGIRRMSSLTLRGYLCIIAMISALSAPLYADREPPIRTGLWVMQRLPEDAKTFNEFASGVAANHNLAGLCLSIPWKAIEKEAGKIDFSTLDKTVAVLRGIGMKYQLCLKPGAYTPAFVYADGAKSIETQITNPHRANVGEAVSIPIPWDPIYQRDFSRIIQRLGEHYAHDPLCVSVVLTCANFLSAEMHLPKRPSDLTKWQTLGDYEAKLLDVYKKYTDEWAAAFPQQEISLHLAKVLDLSPTFCERIIDYGLNKYPIRFTIQNCQLTGRKEDTGMMTYDLVQKYRERAHHGFQSLAGLSQPNDRMGAVEMAALNVVHANGEYWELWHGDGFSVETSSLVFRTWQEAKQLGYEGYKKKLISEGKYRQQR